MGYYNWGEQVGNSFMTMLAQNQQKKLEEKRLGMEQQRVDMAGRQLEDQLETNKQARMTAEQEYSFMKQQIADYNRVQGYKQTKGLYDMTLNNKYDPQEMPYEQYEALGGYNQSEVMGTYNKWNPETKQYDPTEFYSPGSSFLGILSQNNATSGMNADLYYNKLEQENKEAELSLRQQQLAATLAQNKAQEQQIAWQNLVNSVGSDPLIRNNFYTSAGALKWNPNGNLTKEDAETYLNSHYKNSFSDFDRAKFDSGIMSGLLGVATSDKANKETSGFTLSADSKSPPKGKTIKYEQAISGKYKQITKNGYLAITIPFYGDYYIIKDGKYLKAGK